MSGNRATVLAGIPSQNSALYHRVRFGTGDPAAWICIHCAEGDHTEFLVRDIEVQRAQQSVGVNRVSSPGDHQPSGGLSGDRTTATAQALAECLRKHSVTCAVADRTLPYVYAWHIQKAGIAIEYNADLGVTDRRRKDAQEIEWLATAQAITEQAVLMACQTVYGARAASDGLLLHDGKPLTSERLQFMIAQFLLQRKFHCHHGLIVASHPQSADCHHRGQGVLRTGHAVIIDVFPQSATTQYHGDCTRTVVHGDAHDRLRDMHAAVLAAKRAAIGLAVAGASADSVHQAAKSEIARSGFRFARGQIADDPVMPHGTGHGIGLEVHEPILLDDNGGTLMAGEVLTVEPGLYSRNYGGVRVEDMIVVAETGPAQNLNRLPEGLQWP
jgi:Xaa-Pro aminopeptidase